MCSRVVRAFYVNKGRRDGASGLFGVKILLLGGVDDFTIRECSKFKVQSSNCY